MNYHNFKLTKAPVMEDNPEFKAIPEFEALTERQLRFVMLVDWFKSPLRMMKLDDRKYKAALMSGCKLEKDGKRLDMNGRNLINGKIKTVEAARRELQKIQHNEEKELFDAIQAQIDEIIIFLKAKEKTPTQLEKAVALMTKLPTILKTRQEILGILDYRVEEEESVVADILTQESEELSVLDEFMEEETSE